MGQIANKLDRKVSELANDLTYKSKLVTPISELSLLEKSLLFAELATISYMPEGSAGPAAAAIGLGICQFFDRDGSQAYFFSNNVDCVVACRGTEPNEWNDIRADANAVSAIADTMGRVHRGFKQEVDDLWPMLEESLKENTKPLWFTGHSLGGAMATICAGRCKASHIPSTPVALFSYGSPRVGNKRYINFCDIPHYRWVNNNDIVTRVPPPWGYRHHGKEMYLDANGKLSKMSGWQRTKDRWRGFWRGIKQGKIDHFVDHSMEFYIQYIDNALQESQAS